MIRKQIFPIFIIFLLSSVFTNCFTVYPIREEILETKVLEEKVSDRNRTEVEIEYEIADKILELRIKEFVKKENLKSQKVFQTKKIHYGYRKSDEYRRLEGDDKPWNRDVLGMFADLAAGLEWLTIPFRTLSDIKGENFDRESILLSENEEIQNSGDLVLVLRAGNAEILETKLESLKVGIPLKEIKKILPNLDRIEALVYRKNERLAYKVIPMFGVFKGI
ncbi:hypothetical protein CH371_07205 [Leptospira wolffii]|uniref:Uncharacterized protein n=1 Tax=Leptospira wolffii TaxID=409998 RepID=A0A2M9ZH69_9LEPT|nr:hypothetical protein [Leptospira wolffii]PJZ67772.1 hypothetical protein CH371_07205 [Leptospira wolffii]